MRRLWSLTVFSVLAAPCWSCTDDFSQFHTFPTAVVAGGTSSGGSAGVTGGGVPATGGSNNGGSGGVPSAGAGGSAGAATGGSSSGGAGGVCAATDTLCSGSCVDTNASDDDCGGCGNSCILQGKVAGFRCLTGLCRCTSVEQCRADGGTSSAVFCRSTSAGRCSCNTASNVCNYGEVCSSLGGSQQVCSCNGGSACFAGFACCYAPSGCRDLQNDNANCGGCGHACPTGATCQGGQCQ